MSSTKPIFVIDFDSTFVSVEALDVLAHLTLKNNPKKEKILQKITQITKDGMEGKIDFPTSLSQRLLLFSPAKKDIEELIKILKENITPSVLRNQQFLKVYADHIYIISGGFHEYIDPVVKEFGIENSHVLANTFFFDAKGKYQGYDIKNPLSQKMGKVKAIKNLGLTGDIYVLGDGYTDYQIKEQGLARHFFAFTENVKRETVINKADETVSNFDEFLFSLHLPRKFSFPKSKIKVLLLENIHKNAIEAFSKEGYQIESLSTALSEEELIKKIKDITILGIRSKTEITKKVLEQAHKLLAIGAFCIGTNQIDLLTGSQQGVCVFNAPYSNTRSVVELVMGEIVMLYRKVFDKSVNLHKGIWDKSATGSFELRGKKLGIIGYGNIGAQLSVLAENFGMKVYFYDIEDKLTLGNATKCNSLKELLQIADVITVHVDGRKSNTNIIGEQEFSLMKKGVLFLNLSRGFVVDINALTKYIKNGTITGASVDVFPKEPKSNAEPFISPLMGLPNVILTPHIGGSTEEAQRNIGEFVSQKLVSFLNTGNTTLSVNFPQITLPPQKNVHRILHIHKNVPGVVAHINSAFAESRINVAGQYLQTTQDIGYIITDINNVYNSNIISKLKEIPHTIRVRVLY